MTTPLILFGGGKIGQMIAAFLAECGDYDVTVADHNKENLKHFKDLKIKTVQVNANESKQVEKAAKGQKFIINALPYMFAVPIAKAAKKVSAHYFDLTEDVASTREVKKLAKDAKTVFMPQCGLAPGFVSIAANHIAQDFDEVRELRMRVGALPKYPTNMLKYNLTWSTHGLINEYCQMCEALIDGKIVEVAPLDGLEHFTMEGVEYEAFNTSGGLGTLCETLKKKVQNLNYKSIRYPGHRDLMKFLLKDLKLEKDQQQVVEIFDNAIPATTQDTVLVFNTALGYKKGRYMQDIFTTTVHAKNLFGKDRSAIQISTAAGICAAIDLVRDGTLPQKGFVKQEQISLPVFLDNRFGKYYSRRKAQR